MNIKVYILTFGLISFLFSDQYFYNNNKKVNLVPYDDNVRSVSNIKYYKQTNDVVIGITNQVFIRLHDGYSLEALLLKYSLVLIKTYKRSLYLVEVEDSETTLEVANKLHEDIATIYAQPNIQASAINR